MTNPATAIYIDGALFVSLNALLSGGTSIKPHDLLALESFAEAVVLYDACVMAFNYLPVANARILEDALESKEILLWSNPEGVKQFRQDLTANSALAAMVRPRMAFKIAEAAESARRGGPDGIEAFRASVGQLLDGADYPFLRAVPGELRDVGRIATAYGMDVLTLPEWQALVRPEVFSWSLTLRSYRELARIHKANVDELLALLLPRSVYIPPLLSIVLRGCDGRERFLERLLTVRDEFTPLRTAGAALQARIAQGGALGEQLDALREYQTALAVLANRATKPKRRIVQSVWEIAKKGSLTSMGIEALDKLFRRDIDKQKLSKLEGLSAMWEESMKVTNYTSLVEKVFGPIADDEVEIRRANAAIRTLLG